MNKIKRLLCYIISITIICSICSTSVAGYADQRVDGSFTYTSSTGTLEILSNKNMIDYTEDKISSYPWYDYKSSIRHIIIHDGVTKISDYAFCMEDNLVDIAIPSTVTSIGNGALSGNKSLKTVSIPSSVTNIGNNAFGYDANMNITDGFVCECEAGSIAQDYCLKNYIRFDTPITINGTSRAKISRTGGVQAMWSYTAPENMIVTFYSTGGFDTIGLIYDADDYIYSSKYAIMSSSALVEQDDYNGSINFRIQFKAIKGKTYYLATRFAASSITGEYDVHFEQECITHKFECISNTTTCTAPGIETLACIYCGHEMHRNILATGHEYVSTTVEPTCTENGSITYTCIYCGEAFESMLYAKGHSIITSHENQINATCTEDGSYDIVEYCTVCKKEIRRSSYTQASSGHDYMFTDFIDDSDNTKDIIKMQCLECGDETQMRFSDQLNKTVDELGDNDYIFDFNDDGYINAKDYAMLYHFLKYGYIVSPDE